MITDSDIVNYSYKMIKLLIQKYNIKFPQYFNDKSEVESHLLITIARIVNRNRKNPLNKKWKRYCKVAIQMGIREFLSKQRKKTIIERKIINDFKIKNSIP